MQVGVLSMSLIGLLMSSCLPFTMGTASHDVYLVNATSESVVAYEQIRDPEFKRMIAPGVTQRSSWSYPLTADDARRSRLEVDDMNGSRIYCKDFGFQDLQANGWRITITKGVNDCAK
ncbi:MAG: hypothetical protein M3P38_06605 [Chloroflexota bacterium]|nr:hypothetical protein [Chloroflexota bacterium]